MSSIEEKHLVAAANLLEELGMPAAEVLRAIVDKKPTGFPVVIDVQKTRVWFGENGRATGPFLTQYTEVDPISTREPLVQLQATFIQAEPYGDIRTIG